MPRVPMVPMQSRRLSPLVPLALLSAALCGCQISPSVSAKVTTAEGETIEVPLESGNTPVSDGVITVRLFQIGPWDMGPNKPKAVIFSFIVEFKEGADPKTVVVDDITEAPIMRIFADMKAHIVKDHIWGGVSTPYAPQDEHAKWLLNLDNSIRLYRFTVVLQDGTTHMVMKPMFFPGQMKSYVRTQLGVAG